MLALSDNQMEFQNVPDNGKSSDFLIETLERLRLEYAEMLPAKIDEVEAAANGLADKRSDAHEETALKDLRNLAHKLAGSGATFGLAALGRQRGTWRIWRIWRWILTARFRNVYFASCSTR